MRTGPPTPWVRHAGPNPLATCDQAFSPEAHKQLEALFHPGQSWVRHQDHFYRCHIAEVNGQLSNELLSQLRHEVAQVLGLPLAGAVRVTAQRMEPTDGSDRHTDRPLVGYEAARLVVQLDEAVGGNFRAYDGDHIWLDRPPHPNQAVAFELCRTSDHDVSPCTGTRRTVVFHFWHAGNPINAREALDTELAAVSLKSLPADLFPHMDQAETALPDDITYRAAMVAGLLVAWGLEAPDVVAGYLSALDGLPTEPQAALATWLMHLHTEDFHRPRWEALPRDVVLGSRGERWLG